MRHWRARTCTIAMTADVDAITMSAMMIFQSMLGTSGASLRGVEGGARAEAHQRSPRESDERLEYSLAPPPHPAESAARAAEGQRKRSGIDSHVALVSGKNFCVSWALKAADCGSTCADRRSRHFLV